MKVNPYRNKETSEVHIGIIGGCSKPNKVNRFSQFTDDELYLLKRMGVEATSKMVDDDFYTKDMLRMHGDLLGEIIEAIKDREFEKAGNIQ
jgi:hypothetical protein